MTYQEALAKRCPLIGLANCVGMECAAYTGDEENGRCSAMEGLRVGNGRVPFNEPAPPAQATIEADGSVTK